jgi:hypothetical protein
MAVLRTGRTCGAIGRRFHGRLSYLTSTNSLKCSLIEARAAPQLAGNIDGVDPGLFPPCVLITGAMNLPMMNTAERNDVFIAHLAAQRPRLHEAQVVGIGVLSPTNQTRLFSNKPQMLFVAMATRFGSRKNTRVDTGPRVKLRPDRRILSWNRGLGDLGGWQDAGSIGLQFR